MAASWPNPGWGGSMRSLARKQKEEEEDKPWRKWQREAMEVDVGQWREALALSHTGFLGQTWGR